MNECDYHLFKADQGKPAPLAGLGKIFLIRLRLNVLSDLGVNNPHPKWEKILPYLDPRESTLGCWQVMQFGAQKYEEFSWREVPDAETRYANSLLRHFLYPLYYPQDGDGRDRESGLHHDAHASACIGILMDLKMEKR